MKVTVKVCLVLRAGPTETRNQDLRPLSDSFDAMNPMAVLELANEFSLKITFFEISIIVPIYVKF